MAWGKFSLGKTGFSKHQLIALPWIVLALGSCAGNNPGPMGEAQGSIPVNGTAAFGAVCPRGTYVDPSPAPVDLWSCPLNMDSLGLAQPLAPFIFQADCKKNFFTIRSPGFFDTTWEMLPDHNFDITINGYDVQMKSDGAGHSNCWTPTSIQFKGHLDCKDRDAVKIYLESVMWHLGSTDDFGGGTSRAHARHTGPQCQVPSGCYLYSRAVVNQCP